MSKEVVVILSNTLNLKPHENINLHPNPFKDEVKFEFLNDSISHINSELFDLSCKKVLEGLNIPYLSTIAFESELKRGISIAIHNCKRQKREQCC